MSSPSRWLAVAVLAVLAAGQVFLRTRQCVSLPRYQSDDETGYFRAESAAQYRYARLAAQGAGIPALDRDAQYPEGVDTRRQLTTAMERATGWSYRLLDIFTRPPELRWFVILWSAASASLAVPALGALAWLCGGAAVPALAVTAAFALSWAGLANGIGTYGFESFALPMLLLSLAFLAAALRMDERRWKIHAAVSGALLAAALTSWHFSRFHLVALLLALAWTAWRRRRDVPVRERLLGCLAFLLGFALAAGLFFPALRPSGEGAAYGHVYGLLWEKLRWGLVKPADPALLSQDARLLWTGPFQSPEPGFALFAFLPLALLLLPRLAAAFRPRESRPETTTGTLVDALLVLYLLGTLLVARLTPILAFLLCAAALRLPIAWLRSSWLPAVFLLAAGLEGLKTFAPASPLNIVLRLSAAWSAPERHPAGSFANELSLIRWLRANGGPDRPVLANYGLSPSLLTYAGSPVLLQPKFEAPGIRAKTAEYLKALYSDEPAFHDFCRRYGAALFVYSAEDILDETTDGPRYASGDLRLRPDAAAVLFHFHPARLQRFRLLHETSDFRVFAVLPGPKKQRLPGARDPVYDLANFKPATNEAGFLRLDAAGVNARIAYSRRTLFLARLLARLGRGEEALSAYAAAFAAWPPDQAARDEARRLRAGLEAR